MARCENCGKHNIANGCCQDCAYPQIPENGDWLDIDMKDQPLLEHEILSLGHCIVHLKEMESRIKHTEESLDDLYRQRDCLRDSIGLQLYGELMKRANTRLSIK